MDKFNIAIFASGNGSNALNIIKHFHGHEYIEVSLVVSNKTDAGVLNHAKDSRIHSIYFSNSTFAHEAHVVLEKLIDYKIDMIVLAGFLVKIPDLLVTYFANRIMNIHPALLPEFGGKGMYGNHVHEAVINAGKKVSGITIHYVDENYDEGSIIFQARIDVTDEETVDSLRKKIQALEHRWFPEIIEKQIEKRVKGEN